MATPVVLTTGARPIIPVESGGVPMTPVDTLGEPVTVVDTLGEPVVLINNDGTPAFLAYSAKTYLGGIAPYHWLDFINNRALYAGADVGTVAGGTGYTFTRASDGYYTNSDGTLTNFASGAPRRGDRGVLIEGARTNLCLRSEEFDNGAWTKTDITVTANNTSAPDGATTADLLTEGSAGTASLAKSSAITVVSGSTYTTTVFIKRSAVVQWVRFIAADTGGIGNGVQGWFDIQNGVLGTFSTRGTGWTAVSRAITAFANGWYRLTLVYTTGAVTQNILLNSTSADNNATRVAGSAYWLWGFQDELGAFPSSPIITVAAAATRAADVLTYTAGVSYPLSMWVETGDVSGPTTGYQFQIYDGANQEALIYKTGAQFWGYVVSGGAAQADQQIGTPANFTNTNRAAWRVQTNDMRGALNGTLGFADTSGVLPVSAATIAVGSNRGIGPEAYFAFGYIRRLAVVSSAVSDAQLQSMTSG